MHIVMTSPPPPAADDCNSLLSSPFISSPNVAALLKIKILSWSQETGYPVCVHVRIADRTFDLHEKPLTSKSGYFREKLKESKQVELPPDFPGGPETFEMIALFIYGSSTLVDPFNVAALRCAAEFLLMTEEYSAGNLCERFDIYLNQVVLQSWNDTLIVLQKCRSLFPWSEHLLIVSRCIETLAFMACMEILDPERRRDHPVITSEALASRPWCDQMVKDIINQDLWIKDLIALPLTFFKRVIGSLRRQGMKEKYVSPIVLFYADKWVLLKKDITDQDSVKSDLSVIIDLLPNSGGNKASKVIPVGFYLSLLASCLELGLGNESVAKLQNQISNMLHLAHVEDFLLLPKDDGVQLSIMESMFSTYLLWNMDSDSTPTGNNYVVTGLWDAYLRQIAADSELDCKTFMDLIEIVPSYTRQNHDHLYRAMNTFFQSHPSLSQEEKGSVCKYLNCEKLSQEVCVEAVQNEQMPLRLIVQALFVQQLNTQQAFRECSGSFRYAITPFGEFSGSLSSSIYASQNLVDTSPNVNGSEGKLLLQNESSKNFSSEMSRKDYESTSFKIQNLEKELMCLKRNLQLQQQSSKKIEPVFSDQKLRSRHGVFDRRMSKKKTARGQVSTCIGTVNFASQRKYVNRLLKVLQRITLFGRGRSKRKTAST